MSKNNRRNNGKHQQGTQGNFNARAGATNFMAKDKFGRQIQRTRALSDELRNTHIDYKKTQALINEGVALNSRLCGSVVDDYTILIEAIIEDQPKIAKLLLNKGAKPDMASGTVKTTPMMYASWKGQIETMEALIEKGAELDKTDIHGSNALIKALEYSQWDAALLLIEKGIFLYQATTQGVTAAAVAIRSNRTDIIAAMIDKDPEFLTREVNGRTPMDHAELMNKPDIVAVINKKIQEMADKKAQNREMRIRSHVVLQKPTPASTQLIIRNKIPLPKRQKLVT